MRDEILKAIKRSIPDYTKDWVIRSQSTEIQFAESNGVPTWILSLQMKVPAATLRKELKKMCDDGLVYCTSKSGNQLEWWPVGYMAELRAQA